MKDKICCVCEKTAEVVQEIQVFGLVTRIHLCKKCIRKKVEITGRMTPKRAKRVLKMGGRVND